MKKTFKFLSWFFVILFAVAFTSCKDDEPAPVELSEAVSGTYVGKLKSGDYSINDAYVVTITKLTSTAVTLKADFLDDDDDNEGVFNVEQSGSQYILSNSSSYSSMSVFVAGNTLTVSFANYAGGMTTFVGNK